MRCLLVPAGLIVKSAKLDAQVIALLHEVKPPGEFPQSPLRFFAQTLPKLITLKEKPRVPKIDAKRAIVNRPGFGRLLADVEISDAQIAPDDGETAVEFRAPFPKADGFLVTAAVVKQIAEIVGGAGILRVDADGGFENGNLLEAGWETIIG